MSRDFYTNIKCTNSKYEKKRVQGQQIEDCNELKCNVIKLMGNVLTVYINFCFRVKYFSQCSAIF